MAHKRRSVPKTHRRTSAPSAKAVVFRQWRDRFDRPMEILICVGHIAGIVYLLIEHLS